MKTFDKVVGYAYMAAFWCPKCLRDELYLQKKVQREHKKLPPEEILDLIAFHNGINRQDEYSFDSYSFPKVVFATDVEFGEDFCTNCGKMIYK
jgi:hypothetical protein